MAGSLIAVWSPKGGTGKTVIAAGLAMHLVRRYPQSTMLVDLDAGKADIAPLLKTSLRPSILEYLAGTGRAVVHPTGLQILPGPVRLVDEGLVTGELAAAVLGRAKAENTAVVADLDSHLRDSTVVAMEQADAIVLVTTPDLLSIYAARRFTQEADLMGLNLRKFRLVINRVTAHQEIPDREILDLTGIGLAGRIPDLRGLTASINRGMVSTTVRQSTEFAVALHEIAARLDYAGLPGAPRARRGPLARPAPDQRPAGLIPALKRWWLSL